MNFFKTFLENLMKREFSVISKKSGSHVFKAVLKKAPQKALPSVKFVPSTQYNAGNYVTKNKVKVIVKEFKTSMSKTIVEIVKEEIGKSMKP